MGRGLGEYQKAIILALHAKGKYPEMPRRQLREQLFPDQGAMTGTHRVTLCRAIRGLESRGLVQVVKFRDYRVRAGLLLGRPCDDIELTQEGINTAWKIKHVPGKS
jgi:hypothetical protein